MGTSANNVLNTDSQSTTNYLNEKIFIWDNRYQDGTYSNDTYDEVTLAAGTVMGRISASGNLLPMESDAADGSQYPVGVLTKEHTVAAGEEATVYICDEGDIAQELLVFTKVGDDLSTVVDGRQVKDWMQAQGLKLVASDELSGYDNQ